MLGPDRAAAAQRRWTQTDITTLRGRLEAGEHFDDIASARARTTDGVRQMMVRLNLAR
jgi:hypothetical protein